MIDDVFQFLALLIFASLPWFAGWIANGGKREDIGIPIIGSVVLTVVFLFLIYVFA